jgi:diguanylate cyclase (GGDEF)-like protein
MFDDDDDCTSVASRAELNKALADQAKKQRPWLVVVSGRTTVGKMFELDHGVVIGRSPQCDVHLDEEGISRRHARIQRREDGNVVIQDLESRNGTFVNGARVESHVLKDGDKIQIGSISILKFSYQDELDEALSKNLYESATRDALTKVANKKTFAETLEREFAYATRQRNGLSIVLFDVDHFKKINDTYGHPAGDYVLATLAQTVARSLRKEDLLARIGGEEFGIVLRGMRETDAIACADRIRRTIESTEFVYEERKIPVTISLGAAQRSVDHVGTKDLVADADKMLYRAKQEGRNRVMPTPPPRASSARMRAAIELTRERN